MGHHKFPFDSCCASHDDIWWRTRGGWPKDTWRPAFTATHLDQSDFVTQPLVACSAETELAFMLPKLCSSACWFPSDSFTSGWGQESPRGTSQTYTAQSHCALLDYTLTALFLPAPDVSPLSCVSHSLYHRCSRMSASPQPHRAQPGLCFPAVPCCRSPRQCCWLAPQPHHHPSGCRSLSAAQIQLLQSVAGNIRGNHFLQWTPATRCWICLSCAVNFVLYLGNLSTTLSIAGFSQKMLHTALRRW